MTGRTRSKGERAFRFCLMLFGIGVLASAFLVTVWTGHSGPEAVPQGLQAAKPWLAAWRLILFAIVIGGWRHWIDRLADWAGLNERQRRDVLARRWRVASWLLVIEALLVHGVAAEFFAHLLGVR